MGDSLKSPEDAIAYIRKMFEGYSWPEATRYTSTGLFVRGSNARYLRYIEETMYECVQSQYPGLQFKRLIEVHEGRSYTITINKTDVGHKLVTPLHDGYNK